MRKVGAAAALAIALVFAVSAVPSVLFAASGHGSDGTLDDETRNDDDRSGHGGGDDGSGSSNSGHGRGGDREGYDRIDDSHDVDDDGPGGRGHAARYRNGRDWEDYGDRF